MRDCIVRATKDGRVRLELPGYAVDLAPDVARAIARALAEQSHDAERIALARHAPPTEAA